MKYIFFRNDDVRNSLDDSLVELTNIFIRRKIPITHAIEPANITKEVIDWLVCLKKQYPNLIEIIQHGYNHNLNYKVKVGNKIKKGEFGGKRTYQEQYNDIIKGKELMNKYFGNNWFHAFTFPYGARNKQTLKAVYNAGFKVVNGSLSTGIKYDIFYSVGRFLNSEYLFGRKVSWNLRNRFNQNLFQIDLGISVIKKYLNEETDSIFCSLEELKSITISQFSLPNIGVLLHHRYHDTKEKIYLIDEYLNWLKSLNNIAFSTQENIYKVFNK